MRFPTAQPAFRPPDLSSQHRPEPQKLQPQDLDPTARFIKRGVPVTQHDKLLKQSRNWVAQTFFGTLLKQMENSPFKSELFSGGRGGEAFSSLYHQRLAEHMARGAGSKLVNSIVRRIEAKQGSGFGVQGSGGKGDAGLDLRSKSRGPYKQARMRGSTLDLQS